LATTFRAFAAGISTTLHKVAAVRHSFAFGGAGFANGGACATGLPVKLRHSQHKIRARLADLNAVLQKSDVLGGSVFAAYLKTLRNRFQTNGRQVIQLLMQSCISLLIACCVPVDIVTILLEIFNAKIVERLNENEKALEEARLPRFNSLPVYLAYILTVSEKPRKSADTLVKLTLSGLSKTSPAFIL